MAKRHTKREVDVNAGTYTFTFLDDDGKPVETVTVNVAKYFGDAWKGLPEIAKNIAIHGGGAKGSDAFAGDDTPEQRAASVRACIAQLDAGKWISRVTGDGAPKTTVLVETLVRISGMSLDDATAHVAGMEKAEVQAYRKYISLVECMMHITGKPFDAVTAYIDSKSAEEQDALRKHPQTELARKELAERRDAEKKKALKDAAKGTELDLGSLMDA